MESRIDSFQRIILQDIISLFHSNLFALPFRMIFKPLSFFDLLVIISDKANVHHPTVVSEANPNKFQARLIIGVAFWNTILFLVMEALYTGYAFSDLPKRLLLFFFFFGIVSILVTWSTYYWQSAHDRLENVSDTPKALIPMAASRTLSRTFLVIPGAFYLLNGDVKNSVTNVIIAVSLAILFHLFFSNLWYESSYKSGKLIQSRLAFYSSFHANRKRLIIVILASFALLAWLIRNESLDLIQPFWPILVFLFLSACDPSTLATYFVKVPYDLVVSRDARPAFFGSEAIVSLPPSFRRLYDYLLKPPSNIDKRREYYDQVLYALSFTSHRDSVLELLEDYVDDDQEKFNLMLDQVMLHMMPRNEVFLSAIEHLSSRKMNVDTRLAAYLLSLARKENRVLEGDVYLNLQGIEEYFDYFGKNKFFLCILKAYVPFFHLRYLTDAISLNRNEIEGVMERAFQFGLIKDNILPGVFISCFKPALFEIGDAMGLSSKLTSLSEDIRRSYQASGHYFIDLLNDFCLQKVDELVASERQSLLDKSLALIKPEQNIITAENPRITLTIMNNSNIDIAEIKIRTLTWNSSVRAADEYLIVKDIGAGRALYNQKIDLVLDKCGDPNINLLIIAEPKFVTGRTSRQTTHIALKLVDSNELRRRAQILSKLSDPFVTGMPVEREKFVGRREEFQRIMSRLDSRNDCLFTITGTKRCGKTSFVRELANRDVGNRIIHTYISLDIYEDRINNVSDLFAIVCERIYSEITKNRSIRRLTVRRETPDSFTHFSNLLREYANLLESQGILLNIVVDEFGVVKRGIDLRKLPTGLYGKLRTIFSDQGISRTVSLCLVAPTTGIPVDELHSMDLGVTIFISNFSESNIVELFRHYTKGLVVPDEDFVREIVWETGGQPMILQCFGSFYLESLRRDASLENNYEVFVGRSGDRLLVDCSSSFGSIYEELYLEERQILKYIADRGYLSKEEATRHISAAIGLDHRRLRTFLLNLHLEGILDEHWRFRSNLFKRFVRERVNEYN